MLNFRSLPRIADRGEWCLSRRQRSDVLGLLLLGLVLGTACSPQERAMMHARDVASERAIYRLQNDVEFQNYNKRWVLADNPTAILWCTSTFNSPSSPLFTIPIVGKLTSSAKRPYEVSSGTPGPDGMYGAPSEFRYGFTPDGAYVDFYNIATFCTTEPTVWQRETTHIALAIDTGLATAQRAAQEQLRQGDAVGAAETLSKAIAR